MNMLFWRGSEVALLSFELKKSFQFLNLTIDGISGVGISPEAVNFLFKAFDVFRIIT